MFQFLESAKWSLETGLMTGENGSLKSIPSACVLPFATSLNLWRVTTPSASCLSVWNYIELTMLAFLSQGTRLHVLLTIWASYSSCKAAFQLGSSKDFWIVVGMGEATRRDRTCLCLTTPVLLLVVIVWRDGAVFGRGGATEISGAGMIEASSFLVRISLKIGGVSSSSVRNW